MPLKQIMRGDAAAIRRSKSGRAARTASGLTFFESVTTRFTTSVRPMP